MYVSEFEFKKIGQKVKITKKIMNKKKSHLTKFVFTKSRIPKQKNHEFITILYKGI